MTKDRTTQDSPTNGIWRRFLLLIPLAVVLILVARAYIASRCSTYQAWTPVYLDDVSFNDATIKDVTLSTPGVVEVVSLEHGKSGAACVTFRSIAEGETQATIWARTPGSGNEYTWDLRVQDGAIIEGGIDFSGWESIHVCVCVFMVALCILFFSVVYKLWRCSWYGYEMVACGGGLVFALFQAVLFTYLLLQGSLTDFSSLAYEISRMLDYFVLITFLPMGAMALLVSVSNISLIRHEGRRLVNLLGIALSVLWLTAMLFWFRWWGIALTINISYEMMQFVDALVAVAIAYGECLLLSTIVCAWLASRHVPSHGADYMVVLGCGIRADGTPSPLLAGRVDRALTFDAQRITCGDEPSTFVPSGGQGPDEVMSEAKSMRGYLLDHGVDSSRVVLEDRSTTTRENMAFSREVIERHAGRSTDELDVVFSTTNYHVFRGYVCAHQAGMAVEGVGSKTKAYFWPNAFLREFAGLLVVQWEGVLCTYVILAAVFACAEFLLLLD